MLLVVIHNILVPMLQKEMRPIVKAEQFVIMSCIMFRLSFLLSALHNMGSSSTNLSSVMFTSFSVHAICALKHSFVIVLLLAEIFWLPKSWLQTKGNYQMTGNGEQKRRRIPSFICIDADIHICLSTLTYLKDYMKSTFLICI